ncbi:MAG: RidA family protein [Bdellovibrionales bacterium]|nr:RidA family protein [Bdellovibrionales bacterium]
MKILQPEGWPKPKGYANGIAARGTVISIAGQIGWDIHEKLVSEDFVGQTKQALLNIRSILFEAGAEPENLVRLTWYVLDKREYLENLKAIGEAYRQVFSTHYPAMSLIQVAGLLEDGAKVEIEATAVIPDKP